MWNAHYCFIMFLFPWMVRRVCRYSSHLVFCILFQTSYCHRVDLLVLCVSFDLRSLSLIPPSDQNAKPFSTFPPYVIADPPIPNSSAPPPSSPPSTPPASSQRQRRHRHLHYLPPPHFQLTAVLVDRSWRTFMSVVEAVMDWWHRTSFRSAERR